MEPAKTWGEGVEAFREFSGVEGTDRGVGDKLPLFLKLLLGVE